MVNELRHVFEQAERQPEDVQRPIAEMIALALEEAEWDALVSTPKSQEVLARLAEEARAEIVAGTTRDLDELL
jgi:F0F1-type ATP synthase membrane subunit b/b'